MKKLLLLGLGLLPVAMMGETALWMRDAQISPDGQYIAFTYKGDIWRVPSAGGDAVRLTNTSAYEANPIWSPDSKQLAFASDRYGSLDIFVMPAAGGAPTRLTYNSAGETPEAFTPDGKNVLFSAAIQDPAESALFPAAGLTELYQVSVAGDAAPKQILGSPAQMVSFLPNGNGKFLYQDRKGNENEWRKHHTSSTTRDIWEYDPATGKHTRIVDHAGEDRNPIAGPNGEFYFLSERNGGSMNVYSAPLSDASQPKALTSLKQHPVRFLSRSQDGKLCFGYDGELYTLVPGGKPSKVTVNVLDDGEDQTAKWSIGKPSEVAVSPDGKLVAFVSRGDVFVTSVDYKTTKQISSTPEAERHIAWGDDSKSLYYASERDGKSNIYKATMANESDPNMANATVIEEKPVFKADSHERAVPQVSPDGKKLAFLLDRRKLAVQDIESGKVKELTDGSTITRYNGSISYSWSPDSKWILTEVVDRKHDPYSDVAIINVADGTVTNISQSAYFDENARWAPDGSAIIFATDRYGMRNQASWGSEYDVMMVFLNQEAFDNYKLNKEDAELAKEAKKNKDKDEKKDEKKEDKKDSKDKETKDLVIETDGIQDRIVRLTPFSSVISDAILSADADKLFFINEGADGKVLWTIDLREGETSLSKNLPKGVSSFDASADGKTIFLVGSSIEKFNPTGNKLTSVSYSGTHKMDLAKEREYMYDNMVREEQARFYDVNMHGVDWPTLTKHYRRFLPHINNNYDFAEMASELLGELNVSHTGSGYRGNYADYSESTGSLGLLYDLSYDGKGLLVAEVVKKSPFDNKSSKVKPGVIIEKINGEEITPANDYTILLADQSGKKTLINAYNPATGERWTEVVKPITSRDMNSLLYKRWVEARAADVDRWSNGRLGYVHIEGMSDPSYRTIYADILGKYNDREGIVIDIRRNGGGRMHEDIEILFSGKKYLTQIVRGQEVCDMPSRRWNKPSIMVTNEACYSNAHGTPWVYQTMGLGKVVGTPVPGTMTSVNWVTMQDPTLYFGIPVVGYRTAEGYYLENHQLEPDVLIDNDPADVVKGEDAQLRRAVEELLKDLDKKN